MTAPSDSVRLKSKIDYGPNSPVRKECTLASSYGVYRSRARYPIVDNLVVYARPPS